MGVGSGVGLGVRPGVGGKAVTQPIICFVDPCYLHYLDFIVVLTHSTPTGDPMLQAKQRRCRELQALVEAEVKHLVEDCWEATLPFDIQTPLDMACTPHSNIYDFFMRTTTLKRGMLQNIDFQRACTHPQ